MARPQPLIAVGRGLLKVGCVTVVAGLALLIAPNAFWFARSTLRIENRGPSDLPEVVIEACERRRPLGPLASGASTFRVLPQCGDDSLAVSAGPDEICRIYVEGELYHIRAWFSSPGEGDCAYTRAPFSPLLVFELR